MPENNAFSDDLFSHRVGAEPLSADDVVDRPVNMTIFSDSENSSTPTMGQQ